ncbi:MAG: hypothetical protein PHN56_05670 [Candidatus Nanoarchaeia archaeon]|nr:hypothetical protein [Candidatus Nanoarchaeia archaeon]
MIHENLAQISKYSKETLIAMVGEYSGNDKVTKDEARKYGEELIDDSVPKGISVNPELVKRIKLAFDNQEFSEPRFNITAKLAKKLIKKDTYISREFDSLEEGLYLNYDLETKKVQVLPFPLEGCKVKTLIPSAILLKIYLEDSLEDALNILYD